METVSEFWEKYGIIVRDFEYEDEVLINQRAMAETLLESGLNLDAIYISGLKTLRDSPYPNIYAGTEKIDARLVRSYFTPEYYKIYHMICGDISKKTGTESLVASVVSAAYAGYSDRESYDDNISDYVNDLDELGIDLNILLNKVSENVKIIKKES
jgi:hypothetical protein